MANNETIQMLELLIKAGEDLCSDCEHQTKCRECIEINMKTKENPSVNFCSKFERRIRYGQRYRT